MVQMFLLMTLALPLKYMSELKAVVLEVLSFVGDARINSVKLDVEETR